MSYRYGREGTWYGCLEPTCQEHEKRPFRFKNGRFAWRNRDGTQEFRVNF